MSASRKEVSLRGASAKEISRDALLEKVSQEREIRNFNRRASAASLFIQRVWRRYYLMKTVAHELREEWKDIACAPNCKNNKWISIEILRPFLFFTNQPSTTHHKFQSTNVECMTTCFKLLLQSINSPDMEENFCALAVGSHEDKSIWMYQTQKLFSLCLSIIADCNNIFLPVTSLAARLAVMLTDSKAWKSFNDENIKDADMAVKKVLRYMTSDSAIYHYIRSYFMKLNLHVPAQKKTSASSDDSFMITASAITLALRPFHVKNLDTSNAGQFDINDAYRLYLTFILTVPYLTKRIPPILLPALKHESTLLPCFNFLLILKDKIFNDMRELDQIEISCPDIYFPSYGWALANFINLATENGICQNHSGQFVKGLECKLYVQVVNCISVNFLAWLDKNTGPMKFFDREYSVKNAASSQTIEETNIHKLKSLYMDLFKPVHHQWHLRKIWNLDANQNLDAVFFYFFLLRIFSLLAPSMGPLPVLNLLSFTPGILFELWEALEKLIFSGSFQTHDSVHNSYNKPSNYDISNKKQVQTAKEYGSKWVNVLQKISGKSADIANLNIEPSHSSQIDENVHDLWDIEAMRRGAQGINKDLSCMLHLFCATYAHLLLILDDIEFYEKQAPFTLQQQKRIASALNTFVYNTFIQSGGQDNKPIMEVAVRCLHLLYERDCRHKFCPSALWLGPARIGRVPIAAAARAHEAVFTNFQSKDASSFPSMGSVLTTIPHVYPFEERVQMFREFIKMDKVSRRIAGEVSGPGVGSIEIIIRRDHIVEDGYRQLNILGSRLKSSINVSFVSECGLPEAGLDYGGLSKEFLTDLAKAAFDPRFGFFSQTSTSESNLIPNMSARLMDNGIQMIEFLGRVVGKALYEGILLDYSFSLVFVQKLLGRYSFLDELSTLDSELYRSLMYVKYYEGDVADLSLDFTVTEEVCGNHLVYELKPGGKDIPVTNENKLQYVHAMADYKLNRQLLPLANAFYRGLVDLISPSWLSLFNANEFNQLLSGGNHDFDVDDLKRNTRYTGGYSEGSRTVKLFWEVIRGFKPSERCMLLKFVTSCSRGPLLGFKHLHPPFTIHKVACDLPIWASLGGQDVDRLPSASTCYNTLKLPTYKRPSTLRSKLLYAISSNAGFELS